MQAIDDHIKRVQDKLQQLLKQYQHLKKDNERQSKLITELQETRTANAHKITTLQEQLNIVKAAAGQLSESDKAAYEKSINRYIREIDKCIGLLSE